MIALEVIEPKDRIKFTRDRLMALCVEYVKHGKDGTRNDRIRTASSLSGIPLNLIEVAAR